MSSPGACAMVRRREGSNFCFSSSPSFQNNSQRGAPPNAKNAATMKVTTNDLMKGMIWSPTHMTKLCMWVDGDLHKGPTITCHAPTLSHVHKFKRNCSKMHQRSPSHSTQHVGCQLQIQLKGCQPVHCGVCGNLGFKCVTHIKTPNVCEHPPTRGKDSFACTTTPNLCNQIHHWQGLNSFSCWQNKNLWTQQNVFVQTQTKL